MIDADMNEISERLLISRSVKYTIMSYLTNVAFRRLFLYCFLLSCGAFLLVVTVFESNSNTNQFSFVDYVKKASSDTKFTIKENFISILKALKQKELQQNDQIEFETINSVDSNPTMTSTGTTTTKTNNCSDHNKSMIQLNKPEPVKYDYKTKYSNRINKCRKSLSSQFDNEEVKSIDLNRTNIDQHDSTVVIRALVLYFPIEKIKSFAPELKWLYRSWLEMRKYEKENWRTDLVIFIENFTLKATTNEKRTTEFDLFTNLNCSFENQRADDSEQSMCTLIEYKPLNRRLFNNNKYSNKQQINDSFIYEYLFERVDIFDTSEFDLNIFYKKLLESLSNYGYLDSILVAFDGYEYLRSRYDYLIRSDMDVFLTPLFGQWSPNGCDEFYVGRGGYSANFNIKRLNRIATNFGFKYNLSVNLGSTWYSTPSNFRLVSYLTLCSMIYISNEEFTPPERANSLGTLLWPYWHYGVLLLYGQNIAMNHLIATQTLNIIKLEEKLDVPSFKTSSVFDALHIHVFHGDSMFSKFEFKKNRYKHIKSVPKDKENLVSYYSLKMALESQSY